MSILIKALKQAERDHIARAAGAPAGSSAAAAQATTAPAPQAAPPSRSGPALSLAPVEPDEPDAAQRDGATDARSHYGAEPGAGHEHQDAEPGEPPAARGEPAAFAIAPQEVALELGNPAAASGGKANPAPGPARPALGSARTLGALLQTTDQGIAPAHAPAGGPAAPAGLGNPGAPVAKAPRAAATQEAKLPAGPAADPVAAVPLATDPQSEQRRAARHLMTAAPKGGRNRRIAIVLGTLVLLAGALGVGYWQGLFMGLEGLLQDTPAPAPTRTLAERLQSPPASVAPPARPHGHPAALIAPAAGKTHDAGPSAVASAAGVGAAPPSLAPNAAAVDNRGADGIHLRPPEAAPDHIRALLQEAFGEAGIGDGAAAGRIYQQVIELDHNNGDAWIGLASLAANSGDSAGATRAYRRALEIDPGDSIALGGLLGLQSGVDPQEAESRLRLLIVHDGAQPALLAALGKMLARQGRWLEAQETFFKAWAADPSQPDVAFNLAVSLERIRQPLPALSFYRRALELSHGHSARFDPAVAQQRIAALTPPQP